MAMDEMAYGQETGDPQGGTPKWSERTRLAGAIRGIGAALKSEYLTSPHTSRLSERLQNQRGHSR